jgi:hypothetical protein
MIAFKTIVNTFTPLGVLIVMILGPSLLDTDVFGSSMDSQAFGGIPPENIHVNVNVTLPTTPEGSISPEALNDLHDALGGVPQDNVHVNLYGTQTNPTTFDTTPPYSSFDDSPKNSPFL